MKEKTIHLEITRESDAIKIGLHETEEVIWRYESVPVPIARIETRCKEMLEDLNRASRNGGGRQAYEKLKTLGRMLCDELLTREIKDILSATDAEYLMLRLDDNLVHIPWELICLDQEFLCQRFATGRVVKTRQEIAKTLPRNLSRPLKMWILADPGGDLDVADTEGLKIFQEMARMNGKAAIIDPALDSEISADDIRACLKDYDFVHFAGHVDYDGANPGKGGWRLAEGHFTAEDIDRMAGGAPMPTLVFSNACQSARTEVWDWKGDSNGQSGSYGLGNAFLRSGVKHYVGTSWEIMDEPSSYFAQTFYAHLRAGKSTGEAIRSARTEMADQFGLDICWVSYILYGDPTVRYFRNEQNCRSAGAEEMEKAGAGIPAEIRTRGGLFQNPINTTRLREMKTWIIALMVIAVVGLGALTGVTYVRHGGGAGSDPERMAIEQMLIERAEKQQARTERLFEELAGLTEGLPALARDREKGPKSLAAVFDSRSIRGGQEKMILYAIQDGILQSGIDFRLLEQDSFDIIIDELVRKIRLTPPRERTRPNLLMPDLLLIIEVHHQGPDTLVLMRLVDQETRSILETVFEELDGSRQILQQRAVLTKNLLQKLGKYETEVTKNARG